MSILIANVNAYDGSGAEARPVDLVIDGQTIAAVEGPGSVDPASVERVIDGIGLSAAPGFIDAHTHDDFAALLHPDMAFKNRGGVTTCIVGNCGFGAAPRAQARAFAAGLHPGRELPDYEGYAGYLAHLEAEPPGVNIGVLAGHGTIRAAALGDHALEDHALGNDAPRTDQGPTRTQLDHMRALLGEALQAGVLGLSTGLVYEPGRHATTEEIIELARHMAGTGALYASHIRDEGDRLLESVAEAIRIGAEAGVAVQISHHKATSPHNWGKVSESLALIEQARSAGQEVNSDLYPYTAGSTTLESVLSNYVIADDGEAPAGVAPGAVMMAHNLVVASCEADSSWEGCSMEELGRRFDCPPSEAARRVLAAARSTTVILHMMDEADVRTVMAHPSTVIGSDGLPTLDGRPHPRLYNTFARVLGHYARDEGVVSMADAVHRMTGRTAEIFGLVDRGLLRPGFAADVVVFDETTIVDRGTFAEPNQHPAGIEHVLVNGRPVVDGARPTGARPGQVLRRR